LKAELAQTTRQYLSAQTNTANRTALARRVAALRTQRRRLQIAGRLGLSAPKPKKKKKKTSSSKKRAQSETKAGSVASRKSSSQSTYESKGSDGDEFWTEFVEKSNDESEYEARAAARRIRINRRAQDAAREAAMSRRRKKKTKSTTPKRVTESKV